MSNVPYWQEWQETLRETFSEKVFNTYFAELRPLSFANGRLILEVPASIELDSLQPFKGLAQAAYVELARQAVDIDFVRERPLQSEPEKPTFAMMPRTPLNESLVFENFVIGRNSEFAYHAALAVAESPGSSRYNPLLIYGGSGLGKTHLLNAIGQRVRMMNPEKHICYISADDFTKEFVNAISAKERDRIAEFSDYYRYKVDVLLMDDIHQISGRERIQDEFFHIFNALHQAGKQIVMTCDTEPSQVKGLEERLISRFQWGLVVDVQQPDVDTREAILRRKAEDGHLDLPDDVVIYLAQNLEANVRTLEGVVRQLLFKASVVNADISLDMCREIVANLGAVIKPRANTEEIVTTVAEYYHIDSERVLEAGRGSKEVALARQICMYLLKDCSNLSLKSIGMRFGGRDHSTVVHAIKNVQRMRDEDVQFRRELEAIRGKLA